MNITIGVAMPGYYKAKRQRQAMPAPSKSERAEEAMERGKPDNEKAEMKMPFSRARNLGAYHHPPKQR